MTEKKSAEVPAWQRILVARAQGREVDPADVEEARAASRPGSIGWAARVAARAVPAPETPPEAAGKPRFREAILARLNRDHDGGPTAA